jgi:two-component system chemotaxis sensor kinase CheA
MDVSQYLEIFLDESKEHLQSLNTQILNLEQDAEDKNTVDEIFRAAHSLKGMAGTMGYKRMQNLTHDMENVFSEVRSGNLKVQPKMIDVLFNCLDALEEYVANIQESTDEGTNDNEVLIKSLNELLEDKGVDSSGKEEIIVENKSVASSDDRKWMDIELTDIQKSVLARGEKQGYHVIGVSVFVQESCILKAARAFLVYKAVEELGEIIVSSPSAQDIEDEKFDLEFSLVVLSKKTPEEVIQTVKNVSEIKDAVAEYMDVVDLPVIEETSIIANDSESNKMEQEKSSKAISKNKKKNASKPVVNRTVRVDIDKLDVLMNLVSELIIAKNSLVVAADSGSDNNTDFNEQIGYLESVTTNLHESVMKVRMVPIESVVNKFPRMIRDLSKQLDKKMELYMSGEETELDRTVVDEIGDPLMHLLRNSADHGLESAEIRAKRGKNPVGSISLNAYQDGNNVVIEVKDDGNGIDVEKVRAKAIERGTITEEQAESMTEKDIIDLLFLPSFSTAKIVSDVSGRGVGLDVVKSKIEALSGEVEVKTKLGVGSTFIVRLPLTLAIIQALMVIVGDEKYAISLGLIQTIESIRLDDVKLVQSKEVINLRGNVIPIIRLNKVLDIEPREEETEELTVVVVKKGERLAGIVVDELIGQQEIVIKSLGKYIGKTKVISGATILGDGEVALILDATALI